MAGQRQDDEDDQGPAPASVAAQLIISSSIGYMFVYMLRYPITVLSATRSQSFGRVFGVSFSVADSMSLAFLLGMGLAKLPATLVMTSPLYFNQRFRMIMLLNVLTGLFITVPCALTGGDPHWTTLGLFLGVIPTSWVYGGIMTYYEGRTSTDLILAVTAPAYIISGGISRSAGQTLLDWGLEEHWVPLTIFLAVLLPMAICFYVTDTAPKPNAHDRMLRKERSAMSTETMREFGSDMKIPLVMLITVYSVLTAIRQFRDMYADSLFTASNNGHAPSPTFFLLADMLGGLVAFANLMIINASTDAYRSLTTIFVLMCLMLLSTLGATWMFTSGLISGLAWQVAVGAGTFGSYAIMIPIWDRMVAISPMKGLTCTFIIFISDMCGYIVSISMVIWKRFAASDDHSLDTVLAQFLHVLVGGSVLSITFTVLSAAYFWRRQDSKVYGRSL